MNNAPSTSELDTKDCLDAIALAVRSLVGQVPNDGPFKLISATNLLKGATPPSGRTVWELAFKPNRLIPQDESEIGAGGELIVRVLRGE
jgi:hypothetical protein